jgi:hypothetical protein
MMRRTIVSFTLRHIATLVAVLLSICAPRDDRRY